jgi:hypothetical protein
MRNEHGLGSEAAIRDPWFLVARTPPPRRFFRISLNHHTSQMLWEIELQVVDSGDPSRTAVAPYPFT